MLRVSVVLCVLLLGMSPSLKAQSPFPVQSVARVDELELEIPSQVEELARLLADEANFDENKTTSIRQKFGLLAVIGQALAEHPDKTQTKTHGPALRDAALAFDVQGDIAQARQALQGVQAVLAGEVSGEHVATHPWNKLINMHGMMEEMNGRNSRILRVMRRIRGTPEEGAHASVLGVLALALYADTHEVKQDDQLPLWHQWSTEYREAVVKLGAAIRAKDAPAAREWFDKANATCDKCHEVFQ